MFSSLLFSLDLRGDQGKTSPALVIKILIMSEDFEMFWKAYPRKQAKGYARKAWYKFNPDKELLDRILKAIEWQKKSPDWLKEGGQFIPLPASWLNAERWDDEKPSYASYVAPRHEILSNPDPTQEQIEESRKQVTNIISKIGEKWTK